MPRFVLRDALAMTTYIHVDTRIAPDQVISATDAAFDEHLGSTAVVAYEDQVDGSTVFANAGTIRGEWIELAGGDVNGIVISRYSGIGSGLFHNESSGILQVSSFAEPNPEFGWLFSTRGYYAPQQATDVLNDGLMQIRGENTSALGIEIWGVDPTTVTNRGDIIVFATHDAWGAKLVNTDSIVNSGRIEVYGGEIATGVEIGHYGGDGFVNSGSIVVRTDPGSPWATVGLSFFSAGDPSLWMPNTIVNSGIIDAEIAILANDGNGLASTLATREVLLNSGWLLGDVYLAYGDDRIVNSGTIDGFVDLGHGNDFFDGRAGRQAAGVYGGNGDDVLIGGNREDYLAGGLGADQISAGSGDDYIVDGRGGDGIDGGAGHDVLSYAGSSRGIIADLARGVVDSADRDLLRNIEEIIGSRFHDAITGSAAAEVFEGGKGADTLGGADGADTLYGGTGNDRLSGGTGADVFMYSIGDGIDTITDFTPGSDRLDIFGHAGYRRLLQSGENTLVVLSAEDRIVLRNVDAANLGAADFRFHPGDVVLPSLAPADATMVITEDLVIRSGELLEFRDPLPALISDQFFENAGIVMQNFLELPEVHNHGHIVVSASLVDATARGIVGALSDGPSHGQHLVVNGAGAVLEVNALGGGDAIGISRFDGWWNAGRIEVSAASGNAIAVEEGRPDSAFVNTGVITVAAGMNASAIQANDAVWNSGSISVRSSAAGIGIDLHGSRTDDILVNSGSITVTDKTDAADSVALHLFNLIRDYAAGGDYANMNVWNSGTISADHAIRAYTRVQPEPVVGFNVYNSGSINGHVTLGDAGDLLINNGSISGNVTLQQGDDHFDGRQGTLAGVLRGLDGNDSLLTGSSDDRLIGGRGNDTLSGGSGDDELSGGGGNDVFHVAPGFGADVIIDYTAAGNHDRIHVHGYASYQSLEQQGSDVLLRFSASDSLLLRGVQASDLDAGDFVFNAPALPAAPAIPAPALAPLAPATPATPSVSTIALVGSASADTLSGSAAHDILYGLGGRDEVYGGSGNDLIEGGAGPDRLFGESGNDTLVGGADRDLLRGGPGADHFRFDDLDFASASLAGAELISDFSRSQGDLIDLSPVDADRRSPTDDPFTFIGDAPFSGRHGELRHEFMDTRTIVMGDLNGDAVADFWISLNGLQSLTASDFML
jgi:Ca2+-binding RTX toxin-like protein